VNSFDYIEKHLFNLVNVELYYNENDNDNKNDNENENDNDNENENDNDNENKNENDKYIEETYITKHYSKTIYNNNVDIQNLIKQSKCDFYIINYEYNDKSYKYLDANSIVKFPIYTEEEINNYIYINEIKSVVLVNNQVKENEKEEKKENGEETIELTEEIKEFLGPNYNFYKDLDIKIQFKELNYIYNFVEELKDWKLVMTDKFDNLYIINDNNDYLYWNPNLTL
jgi:hypothetical protein